LITLLTIPNAPYQGPYPESFKILAQKNSLLGKEFAKIPEFQDGISDTEAAALEKIAAIYIDDPAAFDIAFDQMYQVGIPEVRKYCSPLQALFWMVEEGKYEEVTRLISNYSLDSLLKQAWDFRPQDITHFKNRYLNISDEQAKQILATLDSKEQNIYAGSDPRLLKKLLLVRYDMSPMHFPRKQRKIIKDSIRLSEKYSKWINSEIVIERLNAPELLDHYINNNIVYDHKIPAYHRFPSSVINERYGDCDDLAYFGKTVLTKAGYDVFGRILGDEIECHIGLGIRLEDGSSWIWRSVS
jgi:hypothetical protein